MSLINDDEIEVPTGKHFSTIFVLSFVNAVHHGLIGGKYAVRCVVILLLAEIGNGEIGQQIHRLEKARFACTTRLVRSARNRTFLIQP